jgi:hypothetical protein
MIGHPSETIDDVQAIADLCKTVLNEGRQAIGRRANLHAGVSSFVPKPHTPFQWVPCDTIDSLREKQSLLRRQLRGEGLKLTWTQPEETMLESWLSRGDRRMADVVYLAWQKGARFDAWKEHFNYQLWLEAFHDAGLDPAFYNHRHRPAYETFPWEHISTTLRRKFLYDDYLSSQRADTTHDCREACMACGILPTFADLRRQNPGEGWKCPDVSPRKIVSLENSF